MKKLLSMLLLLMVSVAISAKGEIKTIVYTTTPIMHCEKCEKRIKDNLKFVKGIKSIETNVPSQTVTIKYDAEKTTPEKITEAFKKINYKAMVVNSKYKKVVDHRKDINNFQR